MATLGPVSLPIGPYERLPARVVAPDPRTIEVAAVVTALVHERRPDLIVEHIGSTAVPGLPGKGIVDLTIATTPDDVPVVAAMLRELGFGSQPGPDPWPPTRPMLVGSIERAGTTFRLHCHVVPEREELARDVAFRDALLADPELVAQYARLKTDIVEGGLNEGHQYTYQKQAWIAEIHRRLGVERVPISPPATIGILGGGQLGRMLAQAARAMGYRVVIQDPDPDCPAAALADRVVVGGYEDVGAALRLAELSDVVTYELEHVGAAVIDAIDERRPVRPGRVPLMVTQDRLAERRFAEGTGAEVAPWREVATRDELIAAAGALGLPLRLQGADGWLRRPGPGAADGDHATARSMRPWPVSAATAGRHSHRSWSRPSWPSRPRSRSSSRVARTAGSRPSRWPATCTMRASSWRAWPPPRSRPTSPSGPPPSASGWPWPWAWSGR